MNSTTAVPRPAGLSARCRIPGRPQLLARIESRGVLARSAAWHRRASQLRSVAGWVTFVLYLLYDLARSAGGDAWGLAASLAAALVGYGVVVLASEVHPAVLEVTPDELTVDWRFRRLRVARGDVERAAAVEQWDGTHLVVIETRRGRRVTAYFDEGTPAVELARALGG